MKALRKAIFDRLTHTRATVAKLCQEGDVSLTALEWEKGYARALEDILGLPGVTIRRYPRRATSIQMRIVRDHRAGSILGLSVEGTILDLSAGGCRIATPFKLPVGEVIALSFRLPETDRKIALKGRVVRSELVDETPQAGIEFRRAPVAIREALLAYCATPPDTATHRASESWEERESTPQL